MDLKAVSDRVAAAYDRVLGLTTAAVKANPRKAAVALLVLVGHLVVKAVF